MLLPLDKQIRNIMTQSENSTLAISVVICTYNRAELVANAIQRLLVQTLDSSHFEVIVVDNNSADNTRNVVAGFLSRFPNLRYFLELQLGLSHARNRGWREAHGKYVGFIDDDCEVPEQWLSIAKEIIDGISPAVFGGPFFPFYNSTKPRWYKDSYGTFDKGNYARNLQSNEFLSGNNIFFRRKILAELNGFNTELGMSGQKIAYGEETALQISLREIMPKVIIYYDPGLSLNHLVRSDKMNISWTIREFFADGRCSARIFKNNHILVRGYVTLLNQTCLRLIALTFDLVHGAVRRDKVRYPYYNNFLYEQALRHIRVLGYLYEMYKSKISNKEGFDS